MSIEQDALDAVFESEIARDATYQKPPAAAFPVRIIPTQPDLRRELGGVELQGRQYLYDVRVSEVAIAAKGDRLSFDDVVYEVTKRPERLDDRMALVWTLDLHPYVEPEPEP